MPMSRASSWRLMPRSPSISAPIRCGRSPPGSKARWRAAICRGPTARSVSLPHVFRCDQQAAVRALSRGGAAGRVLRNRTDDRRDRPRGRARALGRADRKSRAGGGDAVHQHRRQAFRQRRLSPERAHGRSERIGLDAAARAAARRASRMAASSASASPPIPSNPRTAPASSRPGARRSFPASSRRRCGITPDGGAEVRIGVHSHGQGMETTMAQVACEMLGIAPDADQRRPRRHGDDAVLDRDLCLALDGDGGRRGVALLRRALAPRIRRIGAHLLQCRDATRCGSRTGW